MAMLNPSGDTPQISSSAYASTVCGNAGNIMWGAGEISSLLNDPQEDKHFLRASQLFREQSQQQTPTIESIMPNPNRRIVQVFIADANENVPLEESVLFKGDQKLTDLTDTELFFEVPIAETLKAHNDKRVKWLDKESTKRAGKDVTLDPVKIRELKMVVVTIASF